MNKSKYTKADLLADVKFFFTLVATVIAMTGYIIGCIVFGIIDLARKLIAHVTKFLKHA